MDIVGKPPTWYPGVAIQTPDRVTIHSCPVDDCGWSWTEEPVRLHPGTLANVLGSRMMLTAATNQRVQRIEDALAEHFAAHPIADFVRTIMRLRREVAEAEK